METTLTNHEEVSISSVAAHMTLICENGETPFLLGLPGIGKTSVTGQFAKAINAEEYYVIIAALRDRLDIIGMPSECDDPKLGRVTQYAPDAFFAKLSKERNPNGPTTVVLWDEINAAPETVMPVLYRLFQERVAGDMTLRKNVHLVAAGNPASALSAGRDMQPVLRRRFVWLNVTNSLASWEAWATQNGVDGRVIAFLNNPSFKHCACDFDPRARDRLTYATFDSWTKLARGLQKILDTFPSDSDRLVQFAGYVGQAAGSAFGGFVALGAKLKSPQEALANPAEFEMPEKQDALWLLLGGIVNLTVSDPSQLKAAFSFARRLLDEKRFADFGAYLARQLVRRPELREVAAKSKHAVSFARDLQRTHPKLMDALLELHEQKAA